MKIYVIGDDHQTEIIKQKLKPEHSVEQRTEADGIPGQDEAVVFDFSFADSPDDLEAYAGKPNIHLFINATRVSLAELAFFAEGPGPDLYGLAADPTFLERPLLEVSALHSNQGTGRDLLAGLGLAAVFVDDRVGLVTPRIIAMIINEAYYTVMEGTASREDIDTGMKLGTNYPMGPFAWTEKWGLANVYELLEALYFDTRDERYKICPLLKQEYLRQGYSS